MNEPPKNRKHRRALRALQGGKPAAPVPPEKIVAPVTPAQQFGYALHKFVVEYMKGHSGIDHMNVTKVVMQYCASEALNFGASREDYLAAHGEIFDQEIAARGNRQPHH